MAQRKGRRFGVFMAILKGQSQKPAPHPEGAAAAYLKPGGTFGQTLPQLRGIRRILTGTGRFLRPPVEVRALRRHRG